MKVLLFSSPTLQPDFDFIATVPNLGIASIAGNINDICSVHVADVHALKKKNHLTFMESAIKKHRPDMIGLSCMSFQYKDALEMAKKAKEMDVLTVVGGYHPTLMYQEIADSPDSGYFDFIVRGEGEATFRELLESIDKGQFDAINGLSYKHGDEFVHNPPRPISNLDSILFPDRGSRLITKGFNAFGIPIDVVETSRGCVQGCKFCSINHMYGQTFRTYEIERVIADIRRAESDGARSILFVDDNITLNPKRLIELCNAIVDNGLDHIHYHTQASAKGIAYSPEVARKMAKAGFKFTFLGIENVLQKNLDFFNKGNMSNDADVAVRNLRENNIIVSGGLIMGTPEDTKEDMWNNFKGARDMKIDVPIFYISTPYPKTELRKEMLDMGLVTNVDDFTRYDGLTANIRTKQMTDREIQFETWKMAAQFYDSNWKNYTTIHRTYPLWFAKKSAILSVKYIRRKLLRLLGLKTIEDFFEEDCKARTFNMSVY